MLVFNIWVDSSHGLVRSMKNIMIYANVCLCKCGKSEVIEKKCHIVIESVYYVRKLNYFEHQGMKT